VEKQIDLVAMPREGSPLLRTISPYTAVKVIEAAEVDDTGMWLYVEIPVRRSSGLTSGTSSTLL
jgi:hypothetical protein